MKTVILVLLSCVLTYFWSHLTVEFMKLWMSIPIMIIAAVLTLLLVIFTVEEIYDHWES